MSAAAAERVSPAEALARRFGLQHNPFLDEAGTAGDIAGANLARLVGEVLAALRGGHLLMVASGASHAGQTVFVDALARAFGEELRFLSLHGDKLDLAGSRAQGAAGAPARLHQSIDSIELVMQSAIRQSVQVERAGLLIDQADALDQDTLLMLLDFVQRSRAQKPPVQLVLVGGEEVLKRLTDASCARFGDMTAHHFALERLTRDEARAMVSGRLERAGAGAGLFPAEAVDAAHELCGGYADALLGLALWSLWIAGERGAEAVTPALVREAAGSALSGQNKEPGIGQPAAEDGLLRPGKLANLDRPRTQGFDPPAPSSSGEKTVPAARPSSSVQGGAGARAPALGLRKLALITAAAVLVAGVATWAWVVQRPAAPAEPSAVTQAETGLPSPDEPPPGPAAEQPAAPAFEELPAVDPILVDEPAFVDIDNGEARTADAGAEGLSPGAAEPAELPADGSTVAAHAPGAPEADAPAAADAADGGGEADGLLDRARDQVDERRLTTPAGDNARETYLAVLARDPSNAAARSGLEEITDLYLRWGASAERREEWETARIYYGRAQTLEPDHPALAEGLTRLRKQQASAPPPAAETDRSAEALLLAARSGDVLGVAGQVSGGAPPDARDARGKTPLMWAAELGHLRVLRQLEARGADVNLATHSGDTSLMYAAQGGRADAARFLIANGARVRRTNTLGWTALMYAAVGGHDAVVGELLAGGADADGASEEGRTPLMAGARNGSAAVVERLLEAGADVDATDDAGWTALMYAAWQGHAEVAEALLAAGADLDARNAEGQTALTLGIVRQHRDVIDRLVQAGAQR